MTYATYEDSTGRIWVYNTKEVWCVPPAGRCDPEGDIRTFQTVAGELRARDAHPVPWDEFMAVYRRRT